MGNGKAAATAAGVKNSPPDKAVPAARLLWECCRLKSLAFSCAFSLLRARSYSPLAAAWLNYISFCTVEVARCSWADYKQRNTLYLRGTVWISAAFVTEGDGHEDGPSSGTGAERNFDKTIINLIKSEIELLRLVSIWSEILWPTVFIMLFLGLVILFRNLIRFYKSTFFNKHLTVDVFNVGFTVFSSKDYRFV